MAEEIVEPDVLERLQKYGESWLDEKGYEDLKKKTKSRRNESIRSNVNNSDVRNSKKEILSRRQKKRIKHKQNKFDCEESSPDVPTKIEGKAAKKKRQLEKLKSDLGLSDVMKACDSGQTDEHTDTSVHKPKHSSVEIVVFADPAKRKKTEILNKPRLAPPPVNYSNKDDRSDDEQPEINLRDARFDVKMFGIKGFQNKDKESALHDWLIKLGAKPPKRAYHNYKDYMEIRKEEQRKGKDRLELQRQFGFKKSPDNKKRRRRGDGIGYLDGQIGSYKSGVQVLKKDDINKVKRSKLKK